MRLPLSRVAPAAVMVGESLGVASLYLTPQVKNGILAVALTVVAVAYVSALRISDRWLRLLIAGILLFSLAGAVKGPWAVENVLTGGLLSLHGLLWLAAQPRAYRYWRLGIAFFEVILAAILSPEAHMFFVIFGFIMISSMALSFGFLERNFMDRQPAALDRPVPGGFFAAIVCLSFLIFLTSLVIFPLLPRSNWTGVGRDFMVTPGYTEEVTLHGESLSWGAGTGRPLLWVYLPAGRQWAEVIPDGLLRGKVLERFDGHQWSPASKQSGFWPMTPEGIRMEIYREPMESDVLPVPYGTASVEMPDGRKRRHASGEWIAASKRGKRVEYQVVIGKNNPYWDSPKAIHLSPPNPQLFPGLLQLASRLGSGARTEEEKIRRVMRHLAQFKVTLDPPKAPEGVKTHPLERFLFETKQGHCELFASSAALLLRAMGVNTRLIAGFRSFLPERQVLMVKNSDAHAWLEAWVPGNGWKRLDPTPSLVAPHSWSDRWMEAYEYVNAFWYQNIIGYEFDPTSIRMNLRWATPYLAALAALLSVWLLWRRRKYRKVPPPRWRVTRAWERTRKQWRRHKDSARFPESGAGIQLREQYEQLRFGPRNPSLEEVVAFEREADQVIRSFFAR